MPAPGDLARAHQLVEQCRSVVGDACRQHQGLEGAGRHDRPGQLLDGPEQALATTQAPADSLPLRQEAGQVSLVDRLDLMTQGSERPPAQEAQHLRVTELRTVAAAVLGGQQLTLDDPS